LKFEKFRGCNCETDPLALPPRASGHPAQTPLAANHFPRRRTPCTLSRRSSKSS
jgi:hypothetical protein